MTLRVRATPDGNFMIEFFGGDGHTINKQIVTAEVVQRLPVVAALLDVVISKGLNAATEIMERLNDNGTSEC